MSVKQVLVIRKDLKMRRGKECAQCAHASLGAILHVMNRDKNKSTTTLSLTYYNDGVLSEWLEGPFTKICVVVNSEEELLELKAKADKKKILNCLITDSGKTEFNNVPTHTVLAIGPADSNEIDEITGHLKLY